jgi:hypothetical protein
MSLASLDIFGSRSGEPSSAEDWHRWRLACFALAARPYHLYRPSRLALASVAGGTP